MKKNEKSISFIRKCDIISNWLIYIDRISSDLTPLNLFRIGKLETI